MEKLFKIVFCLCLSLSLQTTLYAETEEKIVDERTYKVVSILYTSKGTPFVIIGGKSYHLNESVDGGKIVKVTPETITIKFQDKESEYRVGDIISNGKPQVQTVDENQDSEESLPDSGAEVNVHEKTIQKLPFSTAIISYEYTGGAEGTGVVYIDANQNKIDVEDNTIVSFAGQTVVKNDRKMYDGKAYYHFRKGGEAIKEEWKKDISVVISEIFDEKSYTNYSVGKVKFLGKECEKYKTYLGIFLFWNGIELKREVNNHPMGEHFNHTKKAVDIQLNAPIPEDKFKVPDGVRVMSSKEAIKEMQGTFKDLENKLKKMQRHQ